MFWISSRVLSTFQSTTNKQKFMILYWADPVLAQNISMGTHLENVESRGFKKIVSVESHGSLAN
jgi:hypothetical protein